MPGSFELPVVAKQMAKSGEYAAVVCIGAIVSGVRGLGWAGAVGSRGRGRRRRAGGRGTESEPRVGSNCGAWVGTYFMPRGQ